MMKSKDFKAALKPGAAPAKAPTAEDFAKQITNNIIQETKSVAQGCIYNFVHSGAAKDAAPADIVDAAFEIAAAYVKKAGEVHAETYKEVLADLKEKEAKALAEADFASRIPTKK